MSRFLLPGGLAICLGLLLAVPGASQQPQPSKVEADVVQRVRTVMDNGVKFLKKQQSPQGTWEGVVIGVLADMEGGQTALATLALLNCGVKSDDPAVKKALDYLASLPPKKTYVVGLSNLVFAEARPNEKYLPRIQKNADWLIESAIGFRGGAGTLEGWSYPGNQIADNSNTQYALLGLYAAKQAGATIDDKVWKAIQDYYTRTQVSEGATSGYWAYYNKQFGDRASFSMTVAGVCGLLIAAMGLDASEQDLDPQTGMPRKDQNGNTKCGVYSENTALTKGMNWVGANFTFESPKSSMYNIYGIERLGRLSGQRFIDRYDWYREGSDRLVGKYDPVRGEWVGGMQQDDGSIVGKGGIDASPVLSTSFALLFLSKGRTPVLISKFAWGDFQNRGGAFVEVPTGPQGQVNWNRKHNDTRHVVEFCAKQLFNDAPLSWQVYDVRRRDFGNDPGGKSTKEKVLEEVGLLLQSPVLYINGHGNLVLSPVQEEIIKLYLEEGGFVLAEACCGDEVFARSFKALMKRLFPEKEHQFRKMPAEHAIWKMFPGITPLDFPGVEVFDRGCRTVCVFSPEPLAGYWEEAKYMPKDAKNPANRGEKAYCLARNIVAYATGLEMPKPKLSTQEVVRGGVEAGVTRSHFKAAQLQLKNETPPAPDALKNLMSYLREHARLEVALNSVVLPPFDEQLATFKFNYLHGRQPLQFNEAEIENLKSNLQTGGLLLADAACGSYEKWKEFDKSFREMCKKMFPKNELVVITETSEDGKEDPLFKIARETGINIKTVHCRRELPGDKGPEPQMRNYPVLLEGIKIDGRWVVIYSKYDIGCAIEGHKAADCLGHDKDSALRIGSAVVLYALKR